MDKDYQHWLNLVRKRGTCTYRNGKFDFTKGEGGNHHIYCLDRYDNRIGYMWFDNHCGYFGFCGKSKESCNGIFRDVIQFLYPEKWREPGILFRFTEETFDEVMNTVLSRIR